MLEQSILKLLPRNHVVGVRVDTVTVGSQLQIRAVGPPDRTLRKRIYSCTSGSTIWVGHLIIVITVEFYIVWRSPGIVESIHVSGVAPRWAYTAFWISCILHDRWRT